MLIEFLLQNDLPGFMFNAALAEGLRLEGRPNQPIITVMPRNPDDPFGHVAGVNVRITHKVEATENQIACVAGLIDQRIANEGNWPFTLPLIQRQEIIIDENGMIQKGQPFWFEWMPSDLRELTDAALEFMTSEFLRFVSLLRWQQDEPLPTPLQPLSSPSWRLSSATHFHILPQRAQTISGRTTGGFVWNDEDKAVITRLWKQEGLSAPLAHELRNEALLIRDTSPRSALLMGVAAMEVGLKTHIARVAPQTEWLMLNMPAPPVGKMLRQYLPIIHAESDRSLPWEKLKPLFQTCERMIEDRNRLAHGGKDPISEDLSKYHDAAGDVLHILDYLEGHDWTKKLVTPSIRKALGWPVDTVERRFETIMIMTGPDVG